MPDGLEADVLDARLPAGRDDEHLAACLRAVVHDDDAVRAVTAHLGRAPVQDELDAVLGQDLRQPLADPRLVARREPVAALDHGHPRAEAGEELRDLEPDRAAADDHGARRDLGDVGRLAVRPEPASEAGIGG